VKEEENPNKTPNNKILNHLNPLLAQEIHPLKDLKKYLNNRNNKKRNLKKCLKNITIPIILKNVPKKEDMGLLEN
jgi:hypothetical protein